MSDVCSAAELSTIAEQFPVQPLQYLPKTLRLSFQEGMKLLQEAGFEVRVDLADTHLKISQDVTYLLYHSMAEQNQPFRCGGMELNHHTIECGVS